MTTPISGFSGPDPLGLIGPAGRVQPPAAPAGKDFKTVLLDNLNEVNRLQQEADQKVQALYGGQTDNVAEVFAAINKAGVAFDLLMEVRNKLIDAYKEVQQMRV
jgi:flagellar hook-basal body complex protein FliE